MVGGATSNGQANRIVNPLLTTQSTTVGQGMDVAGSVAVGDRSTWTASGPLLLGDQGDAQLELQAGVARTCFIFCGPYFATRGSATHAGVTMADKVSSNATASIRGIWNTGDLIVGNRGTAEVDPLGTLSPNPLGGFSIPSVGEMTSNLATIGVEPGSSGIVNVTGNGGFFSPLASSWNVLASLVLGGGGNGPGGSGRLAVGPDNRGTVAETSQMSSGGTLAMSERGVLDIASSAILAGRLEFSATNPQLGNTFQVLSAAGGVTGTFGPVELPALGPGLAWDPDYNATNVQLTVVARNLPGDYSDNGIVDAADYTKWRDNRGSTVTLPNGTTPGNVTQADYDDWKNNFGATALASGPSQTVPETGSHVLLGSLAALGFRLQIRTVPRRACGGA